MSLCRKAEILEVLSASTCGVRDLCDALGWKTSLVVSLVRIMEEERMIDLQVFRSPRRGRPEKIIRCTPLGLEFLETYRRLKLKPLRARRQDLDRAVKDALYSKKLVELGHSSFKLFMELNAIVNNIKISSEASEALRR